MSKEPTDKELFDVIVNNPSKNERVAWKRKYKKMQTYIAENITPIEDQIMELHMQKQHFMDELFNQRTELISSCVHPRDQLVRKEFYVLCKFCQTKLSPRV